MSRSTVFTCYTENYVVRALQGHKTSPKAIKRENCLPRIAGLSAGDSTEQSTGYDQQNGRYRNSDPKGVDGGWKIGDENCR